MKKIIIFSDLDGTLLDHATYSFEKAQPALDLIKQKNIPLILCSSKTRTEIEYYRERLDNNHPFISENGGGIFIPKNYVLFNLQSSHFRIIEEKDYHIISLGARYSELRDALNVLQNKGFRVKGFGDMTVEELAKMTGLSCNGAEMAKQRYFDEPFLFEGDEKIRTALLDSIKAQGFNYTEGSFFHIHGNSDKGKAVSIVTALYKESLGEVLTVALGDNPNDVPMFEKVDVPIIVKQSHGEYDQRIDLRELKKADGIGPDGWNKEVLKLLSEFS